MQQTSVVTLLGAGASADVGYPTAGVFLETLKNESRRWEPELQTFFEAHLDRFMQLMESVGELALPPRLRETDEGRLFGGGTLAYPTDQGMSFAPTSYERRTVSGEGKSREPYLEDFFAFWDAAYQLPFAELSSDFLRDLHESKVHTRRHLLREIRDQAVWMVAERLDPTRHPNADYLAPLLSLPGPRPETAVVCTLNFDLAVERAAKEAGIGIADGFHEPTDLTPPASWYGSLAEAWKDLAGTVEFFDGFDNISELHVELLKIHGSLGWFRIEEGSADVGWSEILRDNVRVSTFRYSPETIMTGKSIHDFSGKMGFVCKSGRHLTGKMGQVWFRPDLVFARSRKLSPAGPMLECIARLRKWLAAARRVLVIGYGWRDSHVNDVILEQVARGLEVVNVSTKSVPAGLVELLVSKFPTTHRRVLHQFYCLGGGAKKTIVSGSAITPGGGEMAFSIDLLSSASPLPPLFCLGTWVEKALELSPA